MCARRRQPRRHLHNMGFCSRLFISHEIKARAPLHGHLLPPDRPRVTPSLLPRTHSPIHVHDVYDRVATECAHDVDNHVATYIIWARLFTLFPSQLMKSKPVPRPMVTSSPLTDPRVTPSLERIHVHDVYDRVATQWAGTRYKAWPLVEKFFSERVHALDLVGEIGCGNGKNLGEALKRSPVVVASDVSMPLCEIAQLQSKRAEIHAADIVHLPLRSDVFDVVVCVAVLHHLSTKERRLEAVKECCRVLRRGGWAIFFAWAQEQGDGVSGHEFTEQDVFVPFHQKMYMQGWDKAFIPERVDAEIGHGVIDDSKRSVVFQRYCHVFVKGELQGLLDEVPGMKAMETYLDAGNWAVFARKD